MKKHTFLLLFLVLLTSAIPLAAQQLTTVAVVDITRVYTSFFKESESVRNLENYFESTQNELKKLQDDYQKVRETYLAALKDQDTQLAEKIRTDLEAKRVYINEYKQYSQKKINDMKESLQQTDVFYQKLYEAIKYVAEAGGYSIILDMEDPYLKFYTSDVDVTDAVLDRLKKIAL